MARRMTQLIVDDLTGDVLEEGAGRTVTFGLDGASFEIDLCATNEAAFRAALAPYMSAGRRVSSKTPPARNTPADLAAVRAWAREQGHALSDFGRIPLDIRAAYNAAH